MSANWKKRKGEKADLEALAGNHFCAGKGDVCDDFAHCRSICVYYGKKLAQGKESPYWQNVNEIAKRQREKGLAKYGMRLEDNPLEIEKRIEYLEEELVDGLMYCEWIKDCIRNE